MRSRYSRADPQHSGARSGGSKVVTIDEYSQVISDIYAADWPVALTKISTILDATGCAIYLGRGPNRSLLSANVPDNARASYGEYFYRKDFILDAVDNSPSGVIRSGVAFTARNPHSEFEVDFMRPQSMDDGLFVRLAAGKVPAVFLAVAPKTCAPFATAMRVEFVRGLIRHLEQSLRAQEHLSTQSRYAGELTAVVDAVGHGVVIARAGGEIVHLNANARTILLAGDGLGISSNRVAATQSSVNARLQRMISGALPTGHVGPASGGSTACHRPTGKRPYVIHVQPISGPASAASGTALITIVDPEHACEPPKSLLQRIFQLTNTEAEVALRVLRGDGLKPIATDMALSRATVSTHLQHIFDKTGTHRQAELVRVLLAITPPIRNSFT